MTGQIHNTKFFKECKILLLFLCIVIIAGCAALEKQSEPADVPEKQREQAVGFIVDAKTFEEVWKAFKPEEAVPEIYFKTNLVLFARNTQFYNRISIGKVNVKNGVAEVLAMETLSAMPIEDKVAMSLVLVPRHGITAIQAGDEINPINKNLREGK